LDSDICDEVENYAIVWGIRGKKWLTSWTAHPDGLSAVWDDASQNRLSAINEARKLALEPLDRLHQYFLKANNLREQVDGLFAFLKTWIWQMNYLN
jgi:ATP-dependent helicase/DNAse subunit B